MYEVRIESERGLTLTTAYSEVELEQIKESFKNCKITYKAFYYDDVTGERQYY
jgi:hypothetical protein